MNENVRAVTDVKAGDESQRMKRGGFCVGFLTGALVIKIFRAHAASVDHGCRVVDELDRVLKLTGRQREQVEETIEQVRLQHRAVARTFSESRNHPKVIEIRRATRARIRALLDRKQQLVFDEWTIRRDARLAENASDTGSKRNREHKHVA